MKVIKDGHDKLWTATCQFCQSDLVFGTKDITSESNHRIICGYIDPTPSYTKVGVKCPICGKLIPIQTTDKNRYYGEV